jgi:hypothetical protein
MQHKEVKDTPEQDKYIRRSVFKEYIFKPVARRVTWAFSCVLAVGAVIPLAFKMSVNIIDGVFFDRDSLKMARRNLVGAIALPIVTGIPALLSVAPIPTAIPYSPFRLGGKLVKSLLTPIRIVLSVGKGNLDHFIKTKDMSLRSSIGDDEHPLEWKLPILPMTRLRLPKKAKFSTVKSYKQQTIDTVDILAEKDTKRWRIAFLAAAEIYEFNFGRYEHECKDLDCNTRTFNYPGIVQGEMDSMDEYVNAGIAEVYALAKQQDWSNQDIEKNLHFYGYCFGGNVAFLVAAYFKIKYNVDIPVFADRASSSLAAASAQLLAALTGLPVWYSRLMSRSFLYAAGELNLDSVAAIKKLNPKCVLPFNLSEDPVDRQKESCGKKAKFHLGIGKPQKSADVILRADAVLAPFCDTSKMFLAMGFSGEARIFSQPSPSVLDNGHFGAINDLQFQHKEIRGTGIQFYRSAIAAVVTQNNASGSCDNRAECKR